MVYDGSTGQDDRTRSCPTCRMEISVLATKCRFCGDKVGRPKDETRTMTIDDLGGETITRYAPSSNVMDALEAFRTEEARAQRPPDQVERKSFLGRRTRKPEKDRGTGPDRGALPELDEQSRTLAAMAEPSHLAQTSGVDSKPTWMKKIGYFGAFVAAILILYLGGMKVAAKFAPKETPSVAYKNKAPSLIKKGATPSKILEAAVEALKHEDNAENQEIASTARALITEQVEEMLNARLWEPDHLRQASRLANYAAELDSNKEIQRLKMEVDDENLAYATLLQSVDTQSTPPTATFKISDPRSPTATTTTVAEGDLLLGRFMITRITEHRVRVRDIKRNDRSLTIDRTGAS